MSIGIYKIVSPSGKIYIGQSIDIERRKSEYKNNLCHLGKLKNSFVSHGFENHTFEILEECEISQLNEKERHYQDLYDVLGPNGLNLILQQTETQKVVISEETRNKISISTKGKIVSEETKRKISESKRGSVLSEETKRKIGIASTGRFYSEETREKLSKANKGKIVSEETRRKQSEKTISEEHRKKISEFQKTRKLIDKNKEDGN